MTNRIVKHILEITVRDLGCVPRYSKFRDAGVHLRGLQCQPGLVDIHGGLPFSEEKRGGVDREEERKEGKTGRRGGK